MIESLKWMRLLMLLPFAVAAQPLTLDDAVKAALQNSWAMQQSRLTVEQAELQQREAKSKRGLSLSGSASHTVSDTPLAENDPRGVENGSNIGLNASLPLYTGGSISADIARTEMLMEAQNANLQLQMRKVALSVVQAALHHFQWQDEALWRESTVEACDSSLTRTKTLFALGAAIESDTLLASGNCATERVSLATAKDGVERTRRELRRWVGYAFDAPLEIHPPDSSLFQEEELPPLGELIDLAMGNSPQRRLDSLNQLASHESEKIARASGRPQLNLTGSASTGIRWTPDSYGKELQNRYQHGITLGLSIPILNRGATSFALERSMIQRKEIEIQREQNLRLLQEEIEELWLNLQLMMEQLPATELALRAAETNYHYDRERHALGQISYAELLQSQSSRNSARYRWQQARWSLIENRIALDLQIGKGIP